MAIGIAYLDFHLFFALCSPRLSRWLEPDLGEGMSPLDLLTDAIKKAQSAWKTTELNERLRVYALNQVLYYLADGVLRQAQDFKSFELQLDEAAQELLAFEGRAGWHYRYDDSLARYFEVVGQARDDREAWKQGRVHVERALKDCFDDPLIGKSKDPRAKDSKGYHREFSERYDLWKRNHPEQ
jgi:hypothetical protein